MVSFVRVGATFSVRRSISYETAEVREQVDFELLGEQLVVSVRMTVNGNGLLGSRDGTSSTGVHLVVRCTCVLHAWVSGWNKTFQLRWCSVM